MLKLLVSVVKAKAIRSNKKTKVQKNCYACDLFESHFLTETVDSFCAFLGDKILFFFTLTASAKNFLNSTCLAICS